MWDIIPTASIRIYDDGYKGVIHSQCHIMMEKAYKVRITLESDDICELASRLVEMSQTIEDGPFFDSREKDVNIIYDRNGVVGLMKVSSEYRCERCHGSGEVATDESDGEGHIMRGVNLEKCLCQK